MFEKILFVLLGAAVSWIVQQYRTARSEDLSLINEHIKDIERFNEAAQTYWLTSPTDRQHDQQLAARVRAAHASTTPLYPRICQLSGRHEHLYRDLTKLLFRNSTGGNFEGTDRLGQDFGRAVVTSDLTYRLVHLLRLRRTDLISLYGFGLACLAAFNRAYVGPFKERDSRLDLFQELPSAE